VVVNSNIIILDKLQPSLLPKVKVQLSEDILQTLMIRIEFTPLFHKDSASKSWEHEPQRLILNCELDSALNDSLTSVKHMLPRDHLL
jgi:hypothetical protein